ncbi:MAG: ADP-ribosylglycohydrolase family protein [Armatimonadetes bacterium]|nr:ADP-ribosylglycohydrolase family protein [Armatimonadota bacterium]
MRHIWLTLDRGDVETERLQCEQEGKDTAPLADQFERVLSLDPADAATQTAIGALLDATAELPVRPDFPYSEPSALPDIQALRPAAQAELPTSPAPSDLEDRVYGAWAGRCVGCLLGKPVEGWRRDRMWGYLRDLGRWPLDDYFRYGVANDAVRSKYDLRAEACFADRVSAMPEDDDTNYTTTGLAILKRFGPHFTPENVAEFWMTDIPILHTCTAERVAYRNFVLQVPPPESASYRNPYREWIGAQIRADFFGYAAPGNPALAADMAWRDASISHVKNGIYGEMWAAAMVSAAFVSDSPKQALEAGMGQIPAQCRLSDALRRVVAWREADMEYDEAVAHIHSEWDETRGHDWCHTISNAMIVALGLLWGDGDFARSICRAVQPCFDTDCNGATVGSVMGALLGRKSLPAAWVDGIHDTLHTGVAGYQTVRLADMTAETLEVIETVGRS